MPIEENRAEIRQRIRRSRIEIVIFALATLLPFLLFPELRENLVIWFIGVASIAGVRLAAEASALDRIPRSTARALAWAIASTASLIVVILYSR